MVLTERHQQKIAEFTKMGLVVHPTENKFPQFKDWMKRTETLPYNDEIWGPKGKHTNRQLWDSATGFGFHCGASGLTVIDVDKPAMEWFPKFWAHHKLAPTTTAQTPSGGLHLYYKHSEDMPRNGVGFAVVNWEGYEHLKDKKGKLAIDVRTKNGQIIAPFSPYDTRDKEKMKFCGIEYCFKRDEDGELLDFSKLREIDQIWIDFFHRKVNLATFEAGPPSSAFAPNPKQKKK